MNSRTSIFAVLLCVMGLAGCGAMSLQQADQEVADLTLRLSQGENESDAALAPDIELLYEKLTEAYEGAYEPIPESEVRSCDIMQSCETIDRFRWSMALPTNPVEERENVGAIAARTISSDYAGIFPLIVNGDWAPVFSTQYREYDRQFEGTDGEDFLNGLADDVHAVNHVVNTAGRGIVFEYTADSHLRRVKGLDIPGGEALIHWEHMRGEAVRIDGGYNAYLSFLLNMQVHLPLNDEFAFRASAGWSIAGGSMFIFGASAGSGDIGKSIRASFVDLEDYLNP
jgi:hypothetical protein